MFKVINWNSDDQNLLTHKNKIFVDIASSDLTMKTLDRR